MLANMPYLFPIPHSSLYLSYPLTNTYIRMHLHTPYHAEQQDSCPPSVNVIHEEMEIWAMSDEFSYRNGPAKTSRKTTQPIYEKDEQLYE